jgi:hypothetical protein
MVAEVVSRLKTGTIKSVVPFGSALPSAPYVVVKTKAGMGRRDLRIIAHAKQGSSQTLEDYVFEELSDLLRGFSSTDRHGNPFKVLDAEEWTDVEAVSDDSTISMERVFYVPQRLH